MQAEATITPSLTSAPCAGTRLRWRDLYREAELYKAGVALYTKPLFTWRKAIFASTDGRDLYDFARSGLRNLSSIHRALTCESFAFRPGVALHRNFRGKPRILYVYPWEERLVDLLLYRLLNARLERTFSRNSYAYRLQGFGLDRCQHKIARVLGARELRLYIAKRDVANYFPSIRHDILMSQLAVMVDPQDYLFRLLEQRVRFAYEDGGSAHIATRGIPFGTPVACLFANLNLTPLDRRLDGIDGLHYFRYADDFLMISPDRRVIGEAVREFDDTLALLGLRSKPAHELNLVLSSATAATRQVDVDAGFVPDTKLRHLGLEFLTGGGIRLSRDKLRKIRNIFNAAFRRKGAKLARIREPRKRASLLIRAAQHALAKSVRNVALIDYYLKHVTDEAQLALLDRWLAEEVLALIFCNGHKKSHFCRIPYAELRAMGLPCLVHRRRQIQHGQIAAPFFVWKRYQTLKSSREIAARLHAGTRPSHAVLSATAAFSPSPEAVAASSHGDLVRERSHLSKGMIEAVKSQDLTTLLELSPWKSSSSIRDDRRAIDVLRHEVPR